MKLFGNLMPESVKDNAGNVSSTRIQSYHILRIIYGFSIFMMICEVCLMFQHGNTEVSSQFMIAFGGLLTHHLALLGINKNSKSEPSEMPAMDYNAFNTSKKKEEGSKKLLTESDETSEEVL